MTLSQADASLIIGQARSIKTKPLRPLTMYPEGRICPVCGTILSVYNQETLCFVHIPANPPKPYDQRFRG